MKIIWLVICLVVDGQLSIKELTINGDIISKQCSIVNSLEVKCDYMSVENLVTKAIHIDKILKTTAIKVQYISPLPETKQIENVEDAELIQKQQTINFHGTMNFKQGIVQGYPVPDEQNQKKVNIYAEMIEIENQVQWIEVESNEFSQNTIGWQIIDESKLIPENPETQEEFDLIKRIIRQRLNGENGSVMDDKLIQEQREIIHQKLFLLDDIKPQSMTDSLIAKRHQIISYQYAGIPVFHTYVQIKFNFYFLSELWYQGSISWCKVNDQYVWMHQAKIQNHSCHLAEELYQLMHSEDQQQINQKLNLIQDQYWSIPVTIAVKHAEQDIKVEFGINKWVSCFVNYFKSSDISCSKTEAIVLKELEKHFYLFGIDDFQLLYK